MSVPLSERKRSPFEAFANLVDLRDEVTKLVVNQFGFSSEKYEKDMLRYAERHQTAEDVDHVTENWRNKNKVFTEWFVPEESKIVLSLLRDIMGELCMGNGVYPSETPAKLIEYLQRRVHMNNAIGLCYRLLQEMQYVIRTLPVDKNKYARFAELIEKEIALLKGVRQADNRLIKPTKKHRHDTFEASLEAVLKSLTNITWKLNYVQNGEQEESKEDYPF